MRKNIKIRSPPKDIVEGFFFGNFYIGNHMQIYFEPSWGAMKKRKKKKPPRVKTACGAKKKV